MARRQLVKLRADLTFKGRQFTAEVILWAVRWYLMFPISYRDLGLMLQDRGVDVAHTTIFRWIQDYALQLEKRLRPHLGRSNGSWRVDETYVRVKGRWTYLYRAVDSRGQTIDFLLAAKRDRASAMRATGMLLAWSAAALAIYPSTVDSLPTITIAVFLIGLGGGLGTVLQARLMDVAGDAQGLAAALNHSAFNLANALGPWLGGLAIAAGYGWASTGWVGCGLALGGLAIWGVTRQVDGREARPAGFQAEPQCDRNEPPTGF